MTQDHAAAVQRMRELAEDMDNWPDEENWSKELTYVCNMADAALKLERALNDAVKGYAICGEQPPQMYLEALAAIEQARKG